MKMIDCASPLTATNCIALKKAGISVVGRYLGAKSRGYAKGMTPEEVAIIHAHGLGIFPIWEGDPVAVSDMTVERGRLDAQDALIDARWLGIPLSVPLCATVDFDAQDADMAAVRAYYAAYRAALGKQKDAIYGGITVIDNVDASAYFQTCGWSGGKISPRADIYQAQVNQVMAGISVDIDEAYNDPGFWMPPTLKTYEQGYADGINAAIKTLEEMKK